MNFDEILTISFTLFATIAIINDIRSGNKTIEDIAQAFGVSIDVVKKINDLI